MTRRFGAKKWAVGFAPASFALGKKHFDTWFEVASFQFCMFNQRGHVHCCGCNFAMAKQLQPFCRTASLNPSLLYFCHFVFVGSASDWAGTLKVCSWAILEFWYNDMLLVRCVTALPAHRSWQNCWIEGVFMSHYGSACSVCFTWFKCLWCVSFSHFVSLRTMHRGLSRASNFVCDCHLFKCHMIKWPYGEKQMFSYDGKRWKK